MFELETYSLVNILGLALGIIFGFIAQKNQFCFSGSIKDFLQIKSTKRAASVIMAMIVAVISTQIISNYFEIDLRNSTILLLYSILVQNNFLKNSLVADL